MWDVDKHKLYPLSPTFTACVLLLGILCLLNKQATNYFVVFK